MIDVIRDSVVIFSIDPQPDSTHVKRVMSDNVLNIHLKVVQPVIFQIGDQVQFEGETFTLNRLPTQKQISTREYEYNCTFEGLDYELLKVVYKLFNETPIPAQTNFPLMGNCMVFLQLLVDNLNEFTPGWQIGEVIDSPYRNLQFANETCKSVLERLADEYETEYWITPDKRIHLTKQVLAITPPILEYGKGKGLKEVIRSNRDDSNLVTRLYAFGSERNIKAGYRGGAKRLLMPGSSQYIEQHVAEFGVIEHVIEFNDIYPRLHAGPGEAGKVTAVNSLYKFIDSNIDFDINDQLLPGITAKLIFNTGQLAGQEFEISRYEPATKEITIIPNNFEDAGELPIVGIEAAVGDEYVLIDVDMPQAYIDRAELELFNKATEYLTDNSSIRDSLTVQCDILHIKREDMNFTPGQLVHIKATPIGIDREIRVVGYTRAIRQKYDYRLELADTITPGRIDRIEAGVENNEKQVELKSGKDRMYTRRSFANVRETIDLMYDPDGDYFTDVVKPIVVETAQLVVGTESQQFDFKNLRFRPNYSGNPNDFRWTAGSLEHVSLSRSWAIAAGQLPALTSATAYYIYARCPNVGSTFSIIQSITPIATESVPGFYHFWIGIISSVTNNNRSWQPLHGFTEITGQYITTGVIKSSDGLTYFDLNAGEIGGRIVFKSGAITGDELADQANDTKDYIDNVLPSILDGFQNQLDGVIEQFFEEYDPSLANEPALSWTTTSDKEVHLGDLFYNTLSGKVFRWVKSGTTYFWQELQDGEVAQALAVANNALALAGTKRRIFTVQPYTPYEIGDLWVQGTAGDIMRCATARATGAYTPPDWVKASKYTDNTVVNTLIGNLKGLAYKDLVETAQLGTTVIQGGYIKSTLLDVSSIIVQGGLETTSGAQSKANTAQANAATDATAKMNTALSAAATAQSSANNAQSSANNAQSTANAANGLLADIASDSKLTPAEKQAAYREWLIIEGEKPKIDASADQFSVSKTAYNTMYVALQTYLTPLFNNLSITSSIVAADFRTRFKEYYDARQDLLNAIAAKSKQLADNAQATVNGLLASLGDLAYDDAVSIAKLDSTIIQGGYIKTSLIDVNLIVAKHVLTSPTGRRVHIDGGNNRMLFYDTAGSEIFRLDDNVGTDSAGNMVGGMAVKNGTRRTYISGAGVFSNASKLSFLPATLGISTNSSLVGLLFERNTDYNGISAAVVGLDQTSSGNSDSYGGYFDSIFTGSMHLSVIRITSNTTITSQVHVGCYNLSSNITVNLPASPKTGRFVMIARNTTRNVTVQGNGTYIRKYESNNNSEVLGGYDKGGIFVYDGSAWSMLEIIA
ncbi:MAG: hypothetical protein HC819_14795 [Cyclobacteriaceae bacterium]|nr:hypothetical protein [Cyclobacteriaceae bacterium]